MISPKECEQSSPPHNNRCRTTTGFYCEDCGQFFPKDSPTYQRYEYPSSLWCVIHNIGASYLGQGKPVPSEVQELELRLEQAERLSDAGLDCVLAEALAFIHLEGLTDESATLPLDVSPPQDAN